MNVLALTASPPSELTNKQWDRICASILRQLDMDEVFRAEVAMEMASTFTLEEYEEWLDSLGEEV